MKKIWNEGRVVGYSAYEVYVKQAMANDLDSVPASEREWLASSLAMGSSMIVKINKFTDTVRDDKYTFIEIPMPNNTRLAGANTLLASFFDGKCEFNGQFATKVTEFSPLAQNDENASPTQNFNSSSPSSSFPHKEHLNYTDEQLDMLKGYMQIVDGVYIHSGTFKNNTNKPPEKDFAVNLKDTGRLRFTVKGMLKTDVHVLITGFTIRAVLNGVSGTDTSVNTESPQDGDFLGPAVFPWASKLVFSVPSSFISYFQTGLYQRKIETDLQSEVVTHTPIIDMKSKSGAAGNTTPKLNAPVAENYYKTAITETDNFLFKGTGLEGKKKTRILDTVDVANSLGDGTAVLTVYQKKAIYPPALYSTFVSTKGENYLHPVDIVAPGSVKVFNNATQQALVEYETEFPGTTSINRKSDGTLQVLNENNRIVSIADIRYENITNNPNEFQTPHKTYSGSEIPKVIRITSGVKSTYALSLATNKDITTTPELKSISSIPDNVLHLNKTNSEDNISWSSLIAALNDNLAIDLLGDRLKSAKYTLTRQKSVEEGPYLSFGPQGHELRLYISDVQPDPADIPVGSIGIGWGFKE